ncbi:MAG: toll/interleukin-1 receptor domain-containing protein [Armatimonadetes bacterium]|nr:toll/interleukin-1 receptor domain-containing protein [Armatimonadota bacterium]
MDEAKENRGLDIKAFVSHSYEDADIASALVDLLCEATTLSRDLIRCTSAPKLGIPNSQNIVDRLRLDLDGMMGFVAILSEVALESSWVKFEIGAAWVKNKQTLVLLGPGLTRDDKRLGPLGAIPVVSMDDENALDQFMARLEEFSLALEQHRSFNASRIESCRKFVELFQSLGGATADFSPYDIQLIEPVLLKGASPTGIFGQVRIETDFPTGWDGFLWICAYSESLNLYWPKVSIPNIKGSFEYSFPEGGNVGPGGIEVALVGCGRSGNRRVENWLALAREGKNLPEFPLQKFVQGTHLATGKNYERA